MILKEKSLTEDNPLRYDQETRVHHSLSLCLVVGVSEEYSSGAVYDMNAAAYYLWLLKALKGSHGSSCLDKSQGKKWI